MSKHNKKKEDPDRLDALRYVMPATPVDDTLPESPNKEPVQLNDEELFRELEFDQAVVKPDTTHRLYLVNALKLNVRSKPEDTAPVVGTVSRGNILHVEQATQDWATIKLPGKGFCYVKVVYLSEVDDGRGE